MATPNTPPEAGANAPPQNGGRIITWVKRHTRGVVIGAVMGLGLLAIAGGGLGSYVAYVKQNAPPVVQDTVIPPVETIANVAETATSAVVGGPGSESAGAATAGFAAPPANPSVSLMTANDSNPAVSFHDGPYHVVEGESVRVTLVADTNHDHSFTATVWAESGTAVNNEDLDGSLPYYVTFPAGVNMVSFHVDAATDGAAEGTESLTLRIQEPAADERHAVGSPATAKLTIEDVDLPKVRFNPSMYGAWEGSEKSKTITVDLKDGPVGHDVTFVVTANDAASKLSHRRRAEQGQDVATQVLATAGEDYTAGKWVGTIPAGQTSASVSVQLLDDKVAETVEYFYLNLTVVERDGVRHGPDAYFTYRDNDETTITLKEKYLKVGEETTWLERSSPLTPQFSVPFTGPVSIGCQSDDVVTRPETLTVEPHQWNNPPSFAVLGARDGDWQWEYGTLECEIWNAAVQAVNASEPVPYFVEDGDVCCIPRTDAKGEPLNQWYATGDMQPAGPIVDYQMNIWLSNEAPPGGLTFEYLIQADRRSQWQEITVPHGNGALNIRQNIRHLDHPNDLLGVLIRTHQEGWTSTGGKPPGHDEQILLIRIP